MALFENPAYLGVTMPTPSETLHAIRGAAEVNAAAFASIRSEIPAWLTAIEAWNPTTIKGLMRDELGRLSASYMHAAAEAARVFALATQAIDQLGTAGDPDELPPSVPWSTGELQIAFGAEGRPPSAKVFGRYLVVENVTWDALLSRAEAEIAPTVDVAITFSVDGVPIVLFSWAAGDRDAIIVVLEPDSVPGDVIVVTAPAVQDATFAAIAGTLVGRRRGA